MGEGLAFELQALDDMSVPKMLINYLVDIFLVHIGVPRPLRINHHHGPFLATIQTPGGIDPHAPLSIQAK